MNEWMRLWCCCTFPWHRVPLPSFSSPDSLSNHHHLPLSFPFLLFCLKFNKVWNSGGLKRASGVFWLGFMSHAGAMWTQWHRGGSGEGVLGNRRAVREREKGRGRERERIKRTKEGKSLTRGTGKQRERHRGTGRYSNKCVYEKSAEKDNIMAGT